MLNSAIFSQELTRMTTSFLRLIYPAFCASCNQDLQIDEKHLCAVCESQLKILGKNTCRACAMPFPPFQSERKRCSECARQKRSIDSGFALLAYSEVTKELIHQAKFEGKFWLLKAFRPAIRKAPITSQLDNYDFLVPVPLDKKKLKTRGFNQSHLIAKELAGREYTFKIQNILKKIRHTQPQSELHRSERLNNLIHAFEINPRFSVVNRSVLLVDDVVTSAATVNECARLLKERGAKRVDFFSLARTIHS